MQFIKLSNRPSTNCFQGDAICWICYERTVSTNPSAGFVGQQIASHTVGPVYIKKDNVVEPVAWLRVPARSGKSSLRFHGAPTEADSSPSSAIAA